MWAVALLHKKDIYPKAWEEKKPNKTDVDNDHVPTLMLLAALKVWDHGEELPAHDLPLECRKFIEKHSRYNVSNAGHYPGSSLDIHRDISLTPLSINEERGGSYKYIDVKKTQKQEFDLQTKLKQFNPTLHFTAVLVSWFFCAVFF